MRLTSLVRRSVALTATTALITGALASGLALPAHADTCPNASGPCIDRNAPISPTYSYNGSTATLVVHGTFVLQSSIKTQLGESQTVTLTPHGHPDLKIAGITPSTADSTATDLKITPDLTFAAPGLYDITVTTIQLDPAAAPATTSTRTDTVASAFLVLNVGGRAKLDGATGVAPIAVGSALGKLKLTGHYFAPGARVDFLKAADNTPDSGIVFTAANDTGDTPTYPGYISTTQLHGTYTFGSFTPGLHHARVVNLDNEGGADTNSVMADFWQPKFAATDVSVGGVNPAVVPQGAGPVPVTISNPLGSFGAGSTLNIPTLSSDATCKAKEVSVTNPVVSPDHKTLTANVTIDACAPAGPRAVAVVGTEGAYYSVPNALSSKAAPVVTNVNGVTPYKIGQGADVTTTVNGTGFDVGGTVAQLPTFGFGPGVTATSVVDSSNSLTKIKVHLAVLPTATLGNRQITATNPDQGSSTTLSSSTLFTIRAGPTVDTLDGNAALPGSSTTLTVHGVNYDANGMDVKLAVPDASGSRVYDTWTISNIQVTKGSGGGTDTLRFTVAVPGNASADQRDIQIINLGDNGAAWCVACFGVDTLTLRNASSNSITAVNSGTATLRIEGSGIDPATDAGSELVLFNVQSPSLEIQTQLSGTALTSTSGTASADLYAAAPGKYGAVLFLKSGGVLSCTSCFTVFGSQNKVLSVTPSAAGQGASNVPVTLKADAANGYFFAKGTQVAIDGATVHDITWLDTGTLSVLVDVPADAVNKAHDVTVTNADGSFPYTLTNGFTITIGPKFVSVSPNALGQGAGTASTVQVVVHGTGFVNGGTSAPSTTVSFGPGVTVVGSPTVVDTTANGLPGPAGTAEDDTITATVKVATNATVGPRDITILNPDRGQTIATNGFAVHAGPQITSVTPSTMAPGTSATVTVKGTGFSTTDPKSTLTISGLPNSAVSSVTVVDATTITASVAVPADAARGARVLAVTNPADMGYGSGPFFIAVSPTAPTSLGVSSGGASLVTATWGAPTDGGGAPLTKYVAQLLRGTTLVTSVDVAPVGPLSTTFTGLSNGVTYTVRVYAVNVVGNSPAAVGTGVPGQVTALSSAASSTLVTSGGALTFSGRLVSGSAGLSGRTVTLRFTPSLGTAFSRNVVTSSTGAWSYRYVPTYTFSMRASYAGDATYRPCAAPTRSVAVAARVLKSSPANGSTSSRLSTLRITGSVSPNKHGRYVYLYRFTSSGRTLMARATLSSTSTYAFSLTPGRGTYSFRVYIGATPGNVAAYSALLTLYRT